MQTDIIPRELTDLAARIDQEHTLCQESLRAGLQHAINAGNLLIEAKKLCAHGTWGDWLQENCTVSERTARAYMRVACGLPALEAKGQRVADLSFREAVALLAEPTAPGEATERAKAEEFSKWANGIIDDEHKRIDVLRMALASAETVDQFVAISHMAGKSYDQVAEVKIRAEREAGALIERTPPPLRPYLWFWCDALEWADANGVSRSELFAVIERG